jgi:hypothetical protein
LPPPAAATFRKANPAIRISSHLLPAREVGHGNGLVSSIESPAGLDALDAKKPSLIFPFARPEEAVSVPSNVASCHPHPKR